MEVQPNQYHQLLSQIGNLLASGRAKAAQEVNTILVQTYWEIGKYIVEFEQKGNVKAEYGSQLFDKISKDLTSTYGKGFGRSNLIYRRKLYLTFQISGTLSHKLTWSHYYEIDHQDIGQMNLYPQLLQVMIDPHTNTYPKIVFGRPITEMEPFAKPIALEAA